MFNKLKRPFKKILNGESLVKIKYAPEEWDVQFKRGNWNFLHNNHENIVVLVNILDELASQKLQTTKSKLNVLDVGCGNGALGERLSSQKIIYTGTDISSEALLDAQKRVSWGSFYQSSIDDVVRNLNKYDVVIFSEVLVYVDYENVIQKYKTLLEENGVFIISLYDVWRTKIIWRRLKKTISIKKEVFVKNKTRRVGWNIVVAKPKL